MQILHMRDRILSIAIVFILLFFGVENVYAKKRAKRFDCSAKIARAMARYKKRRYNDVKTILDQVKMNCTGHAAMDTAFYFLGKAYLATKQPIQASIEFEILIQDFPNSSFSEEAHFLLGICNYKESNSYERDQVKTREAIRDFEDFVEMFPKSHFADSAEKYLTECREKLVKKEFMNSRFYEKIDKFDAAIVYYRIIIENFPQSSYIPECQLFLAKNFVRVSRPGEAVVVLNTLLSSDADGEVKKKAQVLLSRIEKSDDSELQKVPSENIDEEKTSL